MTARSADRRLHRRLFHFIQWHPRQIALMRLGLVLLVLPALGIIGTIWSATPPVVYDARNNCVYSAAEAPRPPYAERVEASSVFSLGWNIIYTGSCNVSDIQLMRRSGAIPSTQSSYPISAASREGLPPGTPVLLTAITVMTAPSASGVYAAEWQLVTPNGEKFGPIISRRMQTYAPDTPPPAPIPDQVPPSLLQQVLTVSVSFVFHLMPALVAMLFVLWRATDFMNQLFGLKAPATARRHVMSMMFGIMNSFVRVKNGKIDHEPASTAAEFIGGPAWLMVADHTAALLERGGGFARVVGPGFTFLQPHERVRGVIDLQTQHRTVTEKTLTKDGLPVQADVELGFRITEKDLPGDIPPERPRLGFITRLKHRLGLYVNPALLEAGRAHRFSREAVRRAVYETAVVSPNAEPDWTASFSNIRAGDISDQFSDRLFDEVNAPEDLDRHPLRDIVAKGLEDARKAGAPQGIDVIDMTMGLITLRDDFKDFKASKETFDAQRIANWQMEWARRAEVLKAEGEAKKTQLVEEAHAEAQANMIQALTEGFRIATSDSDSKTISNEVIALRFIDTLEALIQSGPEKGKESPDLTLTVH